MCFAVTAERTDIQSSILTPRFEVSSLKVRVIDQRSRSPGRKIFKMGISMCRILELVGSG